MPVESDADRASFFADFNADEPSPFLWGVTPMAIIGHRGTVRVDSDDGFGALNNRATIQCRDVDIPPGGAAGDAVTFRGVSHVVKAIQPDGTGLSVLLLEEVI
ncbi:hypothetical protein LJR016_004315 [Devosia sp. LjRoot16]|uniref:head-tail joining protein n=1 Tax=Devosia sp. LjRoot16 TaxID=3342271 RepID=UPI003ECDA68B